MSIIKTGFRIPSSTNLIEFREQAFNAVVSVVRDGISYLSSMQLYTDYDVLRLLPVKNRKWYLDLQYPTPDFARHDIMMREIYWDFLQNAGSEDYHDMVYSEKPELSIILYSVPAQGNYYYGEIVSNSNLLESSFPHSAFEELLRRTPAEDWRYDRFSDNREWDEILLGDVDCLACPGLNIPLATVEDLMALSLGKEPPSRSFRIERAAPYLAWLFSDKEHPYVATDKTELLKSYPKLVELIKREVPFVDVYESRFKIQE